MTETSEAQAPQYLSFTIAGTDYGLPILKVKEILQYEEPTRVPGAPASIRGVINVRGSVVPVVDLAVKFGKGETAPTARTCALVVEALVQGDRLTLGVLADAVNEVLDLPATSVEPPPAFGAGVRLDYLTGVGKVGRSFVLLLELDRLLSASEAEIAAQAREAAAEAGADEPLRAESPPPPADPLPSRAAAT
jgi:chemotaxis signal transduction protein